MELGRLRRYDIQAGYAFWLAIASVAPLLAALWLTWGRYNPVLGRIVYGSQGRFVQAFLGCVLLSMIPAALGLMLGWNSAGQRRNDRSSRSWTGFVLGGGVLTCDLILLIAFYMLRLEKPA